MRKLLFIIFLLSASITWSQGNINVFETKSMTFYGLDFTHAKCMGTEKFPSPEELITEHIPQWNKIFMDEEIGEDVGKPYKKKEVFYDTLIYAKNAQINAGELYIDHPYLLERKDIKAHIKGFADYNNSGLGLIYLVEALNRSEKYLSVWVVFFDKKTGDVLLSEPIRSKGKGRHFDSYWRNAFLEMFDTSAKDYKAWKKIYN